MNTDDKQFTVRFDSTPDVPAGLAAVLRKFALAVSSALTALSKKTRTSRPVPYVKGKGSSPSLSMALVDPVTRQTTFLPDLCFAVPHADNVNAGNAHPLGGGDSGFEVNAGSGFKVNADFEVDVSDGTAKGYTANYGTLCGSKLTAGVIANNATANMPRFDVGFRNYRGASMEFYGTDGGTDNGRAGQIRAIIGPTGCMQVIRYASLNHLEVIGGFGSNQEFICGWRNWDWPGGLTSGDTEVPPNPFNVYNRDGDEELGYTHRPMATISDAGMASVTSLKIANNTDTAAATQSVTLTLTGLPADTDLTFQVKKVKMVDENDTPFTGYVLVSPTT